MEKMLSKGMSDKHSMYKIYEELTHLKQLSKKWTEELNLIDIFPKKTYRWPIDEKMLIVTKSLWKCKSKLPEVSPHICQNDSYQIDNKEQVLVRMWRSGNHHTLLMGM